VLDRIEDGARAVLRFGAAESGTVAVVAGEDGTFEVVEGVGAAR
jgi:hypothetical protein